MTILGVAALLSEDNRYMALLIGTVDGPDTLYIVDLSDGSYALNAPQMITSYQNFVLPFSFLNIQIIWLLWQNLL